MCNQNDDLKVLKTKIKRRRIFHFMDVKAILIVKGGYVFVSLSNKILIILFAFFIDN